MKKALILASPLALLFVVVRKIAQVPPLEKAPKPKRRLTQIGVTRMYGLSFMVVLAYVSYSSFQPQPTPRPDEQAQLYTQVPAALDPDGDPPKAASAPEGDALAYMQIPRFGDDWIWTTLEGTTLDVIDRGPGHFAGTALPGGEGNSVYAAHRATHGDPFLDFEELEVGDEVILSQSGAEWVYEITTEPTIIEEHESWIMEVFAPGRWLTLVTCWPKYGSTKRVYVRAELTTS